jgi:hypothetical protein
VAAAACWRGRWGAPLDLSLLLPPTYPPPLDLMSPPPFPPSPPPPTPPLDLDLKDAVVVRVPAMSVELGLFCC